MELYKLMMSPIPPLSLLPFVFLQRFRDYGWWVKGILFTQYRSNANRFLSKAQFTPLYKWIQWCILISTDMCWTPENK